MTYINSYSSRLAAYLFTLTQAEEKNKKQDSVSVKKASDIYHSVATTVKKTMQKISNTQ